MKKIALRTDESRFADLPAYPFAPQYLYVEHPDYEPLRMHYVSEGNVDVQHPHTLTVLLLHGCPTWSYLYRKVIATLQLTNQANAAIRIIAPDFIGCGKSDKMLQRCDYSYDFYVDSLKQFIRQLDLRDILLVCQDWGGPIGLRACSDMPERFAAIVASNTLLPNAEPPPKGIEDWPGTTIANWVAYTQSASNITISHVVQGVTLSQLPPAVLAAYDAPFPDARYKQGMLGWPSLIPLTEQAAGIRENRAAWLYLENCTLPFVTAFSDKDPSTAAWENLFQQRVKATQHRSHYKILNAGHMLQEDKGEELAAIIQAVAMQISVPAK